MYLLSKIKSRLKKGDMICELTGAGVSAESGFPTFRGGEQLAVWKGTPFDEISSAKIVGENLSEVWEWFDYRRGILQKCEPNPAHFALAEWEKYFEDFTLVTQNVDGLHTRAGSQNITELQGNINRSRCLNCEKRFQMKAEYVSHKPEMCDKCSSKVRPTAILPEAAKQNGAYLIEVNPEETLLSHYCDESHRGKAGESWLHLIEL